MRSVVCCAGNTSAAAMFEAAKASREQYFDALFWNETEGLWLDWNRDTGNHSTGFYSSSLVPLLWGCSVNTSQHRRVLTSLRERGLLNYPGGLPTSLYESGQQWDYPNVWAPHQWFPVVAWQQSQDQELQAAAQHMAEAWIVSTYTGWKQYNHTMFEKVSQFSVHYYFTFIHVHSITALCLEYLEGGGNMSSKPGSVGPMESLYTSSHSFQPPLWTTPPLLVGSLLWWCY